MEIFTNDVTEKGIVQCGNTSRIKRLFERASDGGSIKIGFIGGSVTQGSLSSKPHLCYAYRVYEWWKNKFPKSEFTYINAGIGGTTSHFGVARVYDDVLVYNPDFVIVEYSVNDQANEFYMETYEGLIRKIIESESEPAVMILNNVFYDSGNNTQKCHNIVGKHYDLPIYSVKDSLYTLVQGGKIRAESLTEDNLHPNDTGHELIANAVGYFLERLYRTENNDVDYAMPPPLTKNRFENSIRIQNEYECCYADGFTKDKKPQHTITDVFKNGWYSRKKGAKITFLVRCSSIAVQYRRTVKCPAPIAKVTVDGDTNGVYLDGSFNEDWGDSLALTVIKNHMEYTQHYIDIELTENCGRNVTPFYITGIVVSPK